MIFYTKEKYMNSPFWGHCDFKYIRLISGMLSASLEPYFKAQIPDIMVIPISVSYDRVLEEKLYAYELLGVPKPKESASVCLS